MKLVFFDEAKNDDGYPHYHIGAICIDEAFLGDIERKVSAVAESAFGTSELSVATELHAAEIFHRKKNFKEWPDFGKRLEIIVQMARVLSEEEVRLIDVQINCELLHANQVPEEIAFMFLCERANDLVKAKKSLGMLIGDRESDHLAARLSTTLSAYRAHGTDFAFGRDIGNLVDSVHCTHSHLSRFLQLADVYAWILQFRNRNRSSTNPRHLALLDVLRQDGIDLSPSKYKEWPKQ
ncbi:MAG: DUF3800 domain-containing protein [Pseudomonadota bacterium]|nr:DUF3800 domain-containing protein [Pseudomonadota bacterium]